MINVAIGLTWLHVLFAISWFGASIFSFFVMVPATRLLSEGARSEYFKAYVPTARRYFPVAGGVTVLTGILRGLVLGIAPTTSYGKTFIASLVLGIALTFYGARVTGQNIEKVAEAPAGPEMTAALDHFMRFGWIELGGFAVVLGLMVAMRFGY